MEDDNSVESALNSSLMNFKYVFYGKVHPERADVNVFKPIKYTIKIPYFNISGTMEVNILCSQITAILSMSKPIDDIGTIKCTIEGLIKQQIDALGFCLGCGYDAEIIGVVNPLNAGETIVFGVNIPVLEAQKERRMQKLEGLVSLLSTGKGLYLQLCLSDLREAIRSTRDTGFFCYRAVESLRQHFVIEKGIKKDGVSWEKLRCELGVEREIIDFIKEFADPVRHGYIIEIPPSERADILSKTWDVVDKFIEYGLNGYKQLHE